MTGAPPFRSIAIVGAGVAGLRAAERLRELGFAGTVTMVGDEPERPYNRTPLTKALLTGHRTTRELRIETHPKDLGVTWRLGVRVDGVDLDRRRLQLSTGEELSYDGLVIATGVGARVLGDAPLRSPVVATLRTLADTRRFDAALSRSRAQHLLVLGGGFLGGELASTCRDRALDVTVIERNATMLGPRLGPDLGAFLEGVHRRRGVRLRLGETIAGWHEADSHVAVELTSGETVIADTALIAVGTTPRIGWLTRRTPLDLTDGVLADATLHAVGAEDVVVAGDVARWPNLRFDDAARRVEHWITATESWRHAAESLLLGHDEARPFTPLPQFWSEQHGVRIQSVGLPMLADACHVAEGSPADGWFVVEYARGGCIVGAVAVNSPRRLLAWAPRVGQPSATHPMTRSRPGHNVAV